MLPLDYQLPIEYVRVAFPFMDLTCVVIGLSVSAILTILVIRGINRSLKSFPTDY